MLLKSCCLYSAGQCTCPLLLFPLSCVVYLIIHAFRFSNELSPRFRCTHFYKEIIYIFIAMMPLSEQIVVLPLTSHDWGEYWSCVVLHYSESQGLAKKLYKYRATGYQRKYVTYTVFMDNMWIIWFPLLCFKIKYFLDKTTYSRVLVSQKIWHQPKWCHAARAGRSFWPLVFAAHRLAPCMIDWLIGGTAWMQLLLCIDQFHEEIWDLFCVWQSLLWSKYQVSHFLWHLTLEERIVSIQQRISELQHWIIKKYTSG